MNLFDDHDRFVRKNAALASGYDMRKRDQKLEQKGASHLEQGREASCFNCKSKSKCKTFEKMRTGGTSGAVSYGGDVTQDRHFMCERYEPMKVAVKSMSDRQIKSLLKNAMRGNL